MQGVAWGVAWLFDSKGNVFVPRIHAHLFNQPSPGTQRKPHVSVLLIYPPCAEPNPYISVAVLAGYLRYQGIDVEVLDANIEFYRRFVIRENVDRGYRYGWERFKDLNGKPRLNFTEQVEYSCLVEKLRNYEELGMDRDKLFDSGETIPFVRGMKALSTALALASSPFFPEGMGQPPYYAVNYQSLFGYQSSVNYHSSRQIVDYMDGPSLFDGFLDEVLRPILVRSAPAVIGISICFPGQVEAAFRLARAARSMAPAAHLTIGGPVVTLTLSYVEHTDFFQWIDSMVVGDGEIPLVRLVETLENASPDLSSVPGLVFPRDGRIRRNEPALPIDMEDLPPPDYRSFPTDRYLFPPAKSYILYRTSRGCSWRRCAFCRTNYPLCRHHQQPSADFLFEQIRALIKETDVRAILFTDDEASPEVVEKVCRRALAAKLRFIWSIAFRFDRRLTLSRCRTFRLAGCDNISLGMESYNDRVLGLMNKGINVELIDQILSNMSMAAIRPSLSAIAGFPTETEEEARQTFEKIASMKRDGHVQTALLLPFRILHGSQVASDPKAFQIRRIEPPKGLDLKPPIFWFESPGMSRERAFQLAYEFRRATHDPMPMRQDSGRLPELTGFGQTIPLAYDVYCLRDETVPAMTKYWTYSGLTPGEFFEHGNANTRPFRRRS